MEYIIESKIYFIDSSMIDVHTLTYYKRDYWKENGKSAANTMDPKEGKFKQKNTCSTTVRGQATDRLQSTCSVRGFLRVALRGG